MALFGKKKKKTGGCCDMEIVPEDDSCDCGGNCAPAEDAPCCTPEEAKETGCCGGDINGKAIKILGTGCAKCNTLTDNAKAAIDKVGGGYTIEKVTEITDIAAYGAVQTPAMVLGNKVVSAGKVLSADEIAKILQGAK